MDDKITISVPPVPKTFLDTEKNLNEALDALKAVAESHVALGRARILTGLMQWLDNCKSGYAGFNNYPPSELELKALADAIMETAAKKGHCLSEEDARVAADSEFRYRKGLYEGYEYAETAVRNFIDALS